MREIVTVLENSYDKKQMVGIIRDYYPTKFNETIWYEVFIEDYGLCEYPETFLEKRRVYEVGDIVTAVSFRTKRPEKFRISELQLHQKFILYKCVVDDTRFFELFKEKNVYKTPIDIISERLNGKRNV